MTLEQAKRMYKTWKHHPDMIIDGEQATEVIDEYIIKRRASRSHFPRSCYSQKSNIVGYLLGSD